MPHELYYPVFIEEDGTEWVNEPAHEQCEHGLNLQAETDLDRFWAGHERRMQEGWDGECANPVEFVGRKEDIQVQLCSHHFELLVKPDCKVRWDPFWG